MRKYKVWHTVDAVLAGYYEDEATRTIDSLLFGLYGDDGLLHFVGHSRVYDDAAEIAKLLAPLKGGTGFTGRAPGGKSRWTGKTQKMVRLEPRLVAELSARPHQRRPVPARLAADPLAHRQGARGLHDGSGLKSFHLTGRTLQLGIGRPILAHEAAVGGHQHCEFETSACLGRWKQKTPGEGGFGRAFAWIVLRTRTSYAPSG